MCLVFFFKQKTAYEMRISDWSSDVCSSDLFGRLTALLSADYSRDDLSGDARYGVRSRVAVPVVLAAMNADQADRTSVWQSEGVPGTYQKRRNYGVLGRLDYDADFATSSSLTAYRDNVVDIAADLVGLQAPFQFLAEDYIAAR